MTPHTPAEEHPPIQCLLELRYDGTVAIIARHGCTTQDIHDLLHQLTHATWPHHQAASKRNPSSPETLSAEGAEGGT